MLATATVTPEWYEFEIIRGRTARFKINLYQDKGKTKAFNLTGITVKVKIGSLELTVTSGLTTKATEGIIEGVLTTTQTNALVNAREYFAVDLEEGTEEVTPINGVFLVKSLQES